ncbi:MAG: hypothetical protein HFJ28_02005 [Clostridia bacterium]|nr:hypothetical protein [Clostridia bacterium]
MISGLAMGVLVIEARYRSGSTITANLAIKQKKEVFCIPHNLGEKTGYGVNKLIQKGANLVITPQDILDFFVTEKIEEKQVPQQYQKIYEQIGQLPITANELSNRTNKTIAQTIEELTMLEIQGYIKLLPGNKYIRK